MELEKLSRDSFGEVMRGDASVRFTYKGLVIFNHAAVRHLKLVRGDGYYGVSVFRDKKSCGDFSVMRDDGGWMLRAAVAGCAVFNCVGLCRHVIDATWDRCVSHAVGSVKPRSVVFKIARLPLDDDKNCGVYALIRKKI